MLQYGTVNKSTLGLLKELMLVPELKDFFLVGGTALALRLGHRFSIDLDLFTLNNFNNEDILALLTENFKIIESGKSKNTLNLSIEYPKDSGNNVKIDLIKFGYPLLKPIADIEGIRLLELEDIIPMKISAVAGRGSKKDFYDIYYLLKSYTFEDMFRLFDNKFKNANKFHVIKSLTYFTDADNEPDPVTTKKISWKSIKAAILLEIAKYK
ncbi:MAG: nucleotidyl transferase AbiEii/AbiGii toxin family protein [Candidatus Delongbacteria bacterium]|nr:nucleotidyl transferase AbiEii/AbiGii toxin family protein [Candidatus Delongbacteria bacterium]MCG2760731.1 nucleotidyl transferase AbiEii/AbiGii toxin family protein [Candidatus Delongbacteria bacterium]